MSYHSSTIAATLNRINRDIFIPSIQRPYVWEQEQIIRLFDSLMRGYPINSFLFWELQPENFADWDIYRFVRRFRHGEIHNERAEPQAASAAIMVLDGQQRLTSMLIGLTGSYTTRIKRARKHKESSWIEEVLYLDLLQSPEQEENEDADESVVRDIYYGFRFADPEHKPKNSSAHVWYRVADIMGIVDRDQLAAAIEHELILYPDLDAKQQATLRSNLTRLYEVVWETEVISCYIEHDQSYDKVLDIFIRANDGGTKLSKSDLLMSMVTLRWERVNARDATETLTYHLRDMLEQEKGFDRDYQLRAGLFFNDLDFAFQIRNFTPRNIAIIEATWAAVGQALRMSADFFSRLRIVGGHLTASNAVMLVACYIYKLNQNLPLDQWQIAPQDEERIRRWIISVLFHSVMSGAANITMELYRRVLSASLAEAQDFPVSELTAQITKRGRVMDFDAPAIGRFVALDAKGRLGWPCLSLLYDRVDWRTESFALVQVIPAHRLIDERLESVGMPQDQIASCQSWSQRLGNFVLMTADEAREYHRSDFDDWVATRDAAFFARHLLPDNPALYNEFHFLEFIAARKKLITERLGGILRDDAPLAQSSDAFAEQPELA